MTALTQTGGAARCCFWAFLALTALAGPKALGQGQDFTWVASGGGTYAESSNWDLGSVPGAFDRSIFDLSAVYAVTLDEDAQTQYVLLHSGQVLMALNGFTFRNYIQESGGSDRRLVVGEVSGDNAEFTITGGIWERVGDAIVARDAGSTGTLTVSGAAAGFTGFEGGPSEGRIRVGQFGNGSLFVLDGARLDGDLIIGGENAAVGHAVISGPGTLLNGGSVVGYYAEGYLEISNGARVDALYDLLSIGQNAGSYGEVVMVGPGTHYSGAIRAGWGGEGHLTIGSGVTVDFTDVYVADQGSASGTAHISGPDTLIDASDIVVGGATSTGSVIIDSGAEVMVGGRIRARGLASYFRISDAGTYVRTTDVEIGAFGSGNQMIINNGAAVEVTNNGTSVDGGSLLITDPGTSYIDTSYTGVRVYGTVSSGEGLLIADGATVQATTLFINGDPGASVELAGEGSSLTVIALDEKHIGTARVGDVGVGALIVGEGTSVCIEQVIVGDGGTIEGEITVGECGAGLSGFGMNAKTLDVAGHATLSDTSIDVLPGGTLTGDGVILADVINQGGRLAPGGEFDTLTVVGDYAQQTLAGMTVELRGRYQSEYDHLEVVGLADLAGELLCEIAEGATFAIGNQLRILDALQVQGRFSTARFSRPNGQRPELTYETDGVIVTVATGLTLDSTELFKGQDASVTITNSRPNTPTYLIYSLTGLGETEIPQLGITCGVRRPTLAAGPVRTNAQGEATFVVRVPVINGNPRVWLQAVQMHDASGVLQRTIRD